MLAEVGRDVSNNLSNIQPWLAVMKETFLSVRVDPLTTKR